MLRPNIALAIVVGAGTACKNEGNITRLVPEIVVIPDAVDFEGVVVDYTDTREIVIANGGRAELEIDEMRIEGEHADHFVLPSIPEVVEPDDQIAIPLEFWPETYIDYTATLHIDTNDEEKPVAEVPLSGEGIPAPTPDISVSQSVLEFIDVAKGDDDLQWFTVTNVGDDTLVITDTQQAGAGAFVVQSDPFGMTLGPDESAQVIVEYEPTWDKGDNGSLTLFSNDPDEPEVMVTFLGNGGGGFEYPVAVIDGPDSAEPLDSVTFDGNESYDPGGYEPLTYAWTVSQQPHGTSEGPADPAGATTGMWLNKAGTWVIELKVTNTIGVVSAPAKHTVDVVPGDSIWVELSWNTGDSDFDLHLAQEGVELFGGDGDCNWCNPNPDWGTNSDEDDPELALDNRIGYGPEDIRITSPVEDEYMVRVHYFEDFLAGSTTATVDIWLEGTLADSRSMLLEDNQMWEVGYIRWPEALFVPVDTVGPPGARACPD